MAKRRMHNIAYARPGVIMHFPPCFLWSFNIPYQSTDRSINRSINQAIKQSIDLDRSIDRPTIQPTNQSINPSIKIRLFDRKVKSQLHVINAIHDVHLHIVTFHRWVVYEHMRMHNTIQYNTVCIYNAT